MGSSSKRADPIPCRIVPSARARRFDPGTVARRFRDLLDAGASLRVSGAARDDPRRLLRRHPPCFELALFETRFFLSGVLQNPDLRFFVAYVVQQRAGRTRHDVFPRIFYKDVALQWRSASHLVHNDDELWVGKGDVRAYRRDGHVHEESDESTTDLPLELQPALESLNRRSTPRSNIAALDLVLRNAPSHRVRPYREFSEPRRRAAADRRNLVNGGRSVVRFTRADDPNSLTIVPGYEPDFTRGVFERGTLRSKLYGGLVRRFRILSSNRRIQWLFFAGPRHVWIIPPQATTTELSSFGLRTIDVVAADELFVPGFEYHYLEDEQDPASWVSQIPNGHVGPHSPLDDTRADASPWLDRLPLIREFRRRVLDRVSRRG